MNEELDRLFAQIHALEDEIERRLDTQRTQFRYHLARGRAVFDAGVAQAHRRMRTSSLRYLVSAPLRHLLLAPVVYAMVIPLALLDLSMTAYQWICFSIWGIARVPRRQFVVLDRHRLPYLNTIEKLNCLYCSYGNGVLAYAREIAARTEQYWCPIRHAIQIRGQHGHYRDFAEYGDAETYRARLEELRSKLR
jgi:hypothetical protein